MAKKKSGYGVTFDTGTSKSKKKTSGYGLGLDNSDKVSDTNSYLDGKIDSTIKRLNANGVDVSLDSVTDKRNPVEKFLNLPKNQNFIFDIIELSGRPQQALFGAIDNTIKGEDAFKGAVEGISGKKQTYGGQILRELGVPDDDIIGNIGIDDVLGFGLDIFLDPMDMATMGATSLSPIANFAKNTGDMNTFTKVFDKQIDLLSSGKKLSPTEWISQAVQTGARGGIKKADEFLEGALKHIDTSRLNHYTKLANQGNDVAKNAIKAYKKAGLYDSYKATKDLIGNTFDFLNKPNGYKKIYDNVQNIHGRAIIADTLGKGSAKQGLDYVDELYKNLSKVELDDLKNFGIFDKDTFRDAYNNLLDINTTASRNLTREKGISFNNLLASMQNEVVGTSKFLPKNGAIDEALKKADEVYKAIEDKKKVFGKYFKGGESIFDFFDPKKSTQNGYVFKSAKDAFDFGQMFAPGNKLAGIRINTNPSKFTMPTTLKTLQAEGLSKYLDEKDIINPYGGASTAIQNAILGNKQFSTANYMPKSFGQATQEKVNEIIAEMPRKDNSIGTLVTNASKKGLDESETSFFTTDAINTLFREYSGTDAFMIGKSKKAKETMRELINDGIFTESLEENLGNMITSKTNTFESLVKTEEVGFTSLYNDLHGIYGELKDLKRAGKPISPELASRMANNSTLIVPDMKGITDVKSYSNMGKIKVKGSELEQLIDVTTHKLHGTKDVITNAVEENVIPQKLKSMIKNLGDSDNVSDFWVSSELLNLLNLNKAINKTPNVIIDTIKQANDLFKRSKLLSPAYNIRNVIGNSFNLMASGVPLEKIPSYYSKSIDTIKAFKQAEKMILDGVSLDKLPTKLQKAFNKGADLIQMGFLQDTGSKLMDTADLAKIGTRSNKFTQGIEAINRANANLNSFMDDASRMALYLFADDNPNWLSRQGYLNVKDAISSILFDPSAVSTTEKEVLKNIIPFYTFTKKNLAYHFKNILENPTPYKRTYKAIKGAWDNTGLSDEEINSYRKEGMEIPIYQNNNGEVTTLRPNLPFSDLVEFTSNPVNRLVSMITPAIRAPYEIATNTNTFNNMPISRFAGQKSKLFEGTPLSGLPKQVDNRWTDYLLGAIGIDTPLKTIKGGVNTLLNPSVDSLGQFLNMTSTNNPQSALIQNKYQTLTDLEEFVKYLKQEGNPYYTMEEIKKQQNNTSKSKSKKKKGYGLF